MRKPKLERIANGQHRVRYTVAGKRMVEYFGSDPAEAEMRYAEWWSIYCQAALDKKVNTVVETTGFNVASGLPATSTDHLTLSELSTLYVEWARDIYKTRARQQGKTPGYHQHHISSLVIDVLGDLYWSELDTVQFEKLQKALIDQGKNRTRVNQICTDLITWMSWAYAKKHISHRIDLELRSVKRLRAGDYGVKEKSDKRPVMWSEAEQLLPFLAPNVRAMVTAQFWGGMRPGEVVIMRPTDLMVVAAEHLEEHGIREVMYYLPSSHKNSWRENEYSAKLTKIIPWRVQRLIMPLIEDCGSSEEFIFKPGPAFEWAVEFEIAARAARPCPSGRKAPSKVRKRQENRDTRNGRINRFCRDRISRGCYSQLIEKGFQRAARSGKDLERWTPNQLRHGAMTMMADHGFVQAGSDLLGHERLATSLTHYDHETLLRMNRVAGRLAEIDPPTDD